MQRLHRDGRERGLGQCAGDGVELDVHLQNCDDHNVLSPNVLRCARLHGVHTQSCAIGDMAANTRRCVRNCRPTKW